MHFLRVHCHRVATESLVVFGPAHLRSRVRLDGHIELYVLIKLGRDVHRKICVQSNKASL